MTVVEKRPNSISVSMQKGNVRKRTSLINQMRGVQYLSIIGKDLQVAINTNNKESIRRLFYELVEIVKPYI
jgi:hypothetical protein